MKNKKAYRLFKLLMKLVGIISSINRVLDLFDWL